MTNLYEGLIFVVFVQIDLIIDKAPITRINQLAKNLNEQINIQSRKHQFLYNIYAFKFKNWGR